MHTINWQSLPSVVQWAVVVYAALCYLLAGLGLGFAYLARYYFPQWQSNEGTSGEPLASEEEMRATLIKYFLLWLVAPLIVAYLLVLAVYGAFVIGILGLDRRKPKLSAPLEN